MGKVEPLTIIDDPSAWLARDYPDPAAYAYHLTPPDLTELDAAVASASAAVAAGKEVQVRDPRKLMLQQLHLCGYCRTVCFYHRPLEAGIEALQCLNLVEDPYHAHVWVITANHQGRVQAPDAGRQVGGGP